MLFDEFEDFGDKRDRGIKSSFASRDRHSIGTTYLDYLFCDDRLEINTTRVV
jgi:hypothetical protein